MAVRRQALQGSPELQQFVLAEVRPTGRQLGVGSYGSVEEVEVNGLVCAGKRLHEALVEQGNAGVTSITRKYLRECQVINCPLLLGAVYKFFCFGGANAIGAQGSPTRNI